MGGRHEITLSILGVSILVSSRQRSCALGIARYFQPLVDIPWRSPDVIIKCELRQVSRYLFRARPISQPSPFQGMSYLIPGQSLYKPWTSPSPPLPPLTLPPFRERFICLHAAVIRSPRSASAILLVGGRGTGKTYLSTKLSRESGYELLSDEMAFIHKRSVIVESFPRAIGTFRHDRRGRLLKHMEPANISDLHISNQPGIIKGIVMLMEKESPMIPGHLIPVSHEPLVRHLLSHQIESGTSRDEAITTLFMLANQVQGVAAKAVSFGSFHRIGNELTQWFRDLELQVDAAHT
jgi:hypothetical protein